MKLNPNQTSVFYKEAIERDLLERDFIGNIIILLQNRVNHHDPPDENVKQTSFRIIRSFFYDSLCLINYMLRCNFKKLKN